MKLLRTEEVRKIFGGYCKSHFDEIMRHPDFPKPVKPYPGARALMWIDDEIEAYIEKLRKDRDEANVNS